MIAAEVIVDESKVVRAQQYELWRRFMDRQGEMGDVWYQKHVAKDHPLELSTLVEMLAAAGFEAAGCYWRYLNFAIIRAQRAA